MMGPMGQGHENPMAEGTELAWNRAAHGPEGLSPWYWLWLPIGLVLALFVSGQVFPAFYSAWISSERGVLEFLHVAIPVASLALAVLTLRLSAVRGHRLLWLWLGLAAVGSLYVAGEEASWGQHYLNWSTPEYWQGINDQRETNLHNVSSWLDQKPRALLEVGVVVGGLVVPIAALRWPNIRRTRYAIILPPLICLPSAALAEITRMLERVFGFFDIGIVLFQRTSEVQETYFYIFILLYLVVLRRRLLSERNGASRPTGRS